MERKLESTPIGNVRKTWPRVGFELKTILDCSIDQARSQWRLRVQGWTQWAF